MIVFDLRCPKSHVFEGWFRDSAAFEAQTAAGDLVCPVCGSVDIAKALMAPNISAKGNARRGARQGRADQGRAEQAAEAPQTLANIPAAESAAGPAAGGDAPSPESFAAAVTALRELHQAIEKNCDYVGENFAEEARKIHYGETDPRGIYGEASLEEAKELREEGVEVMAVPRLPRQDA
ncbi:MAG TPA: DUF1178 family protein [Alphaproteobacteria bacterium]|jgi:hypothetical protein